MYMTVSEHVIEWVFRYICEIYSLIVTGADPGIFVRGGGVQLSENFDKQKKKKKTEEEWFKSIFQTIICIQVGFFFFFFGGGGGKGMACPSLQIHRWHGRFDIVHVYVFGMGGLGVLPQKIFSLNGVKSCNSRQG